LIQGIHLAVLVGTGMAAILLTITPFALPLIFGEDFKPAIPSALILIVAGVTASINSVLENGARGLGKPSVVLASESVGLVATILSLALLLTPLGILGASLASLFGYSSILFAYLLQISRITELSLGTILLPGHSDVDWILMRARSLLTGDFR
jgi:O-antigen/teichoic acid export membrane protein